MPWAIYGKRPQDKMMRALDYRGHRVSKLELAGTFAEKNDAQEHLDKRIDPNNPNTFEIRKVK